MTEEMNTDLMNVKNLLDSAVKAGLFHDSANVVKMTASYDRIFNYISTAELVKEKKIEQEREDYKPHGVNLVGALHEK